MKKTSRKKLNNYIDVYKIVICICILINVVIVIYNIANYNVKEFIENNEICVNEKDKLFSDDLKDNKYNVSIEDEIKINNYIINEFNMCKKEQNEVYMYIYSKHILDAPIVKSSYDEKYLRRNLKGEYSVEGTLYIQQVSTSNILTICGHNMQNGKAFGRLKNMLQKDIKNDKDIKHIFYVYNGENITKYIFDSVYEYIEGKENVNIPLSSTNSIILKTCTESISDNNSRRLYLLKEYVN